MSDELRIQSMEDFERILDENPRIRESIRRKLITDEERELPRIVESLVNQVNRLTQAVAEGFAHAAEDRAAIRQETKASFAEAAEDRAAIRQETKAGFAEAAEDRAAIRQETKAGFAEAAEDRAAIRQETKAGFAEAAEDRAAIRQEMHAGFAHAAEDRAAIRQEMHAGFAHAAEDRAAIRQEMHAGFAEAAEDRAAIRQEMQAGFAEAAEDRAAIRQEMQAGFAEAAEDRAAIRQEMRAGFAEAAEDRAAIRQEMQAGFAEAAEDRAKIREDIVEILKSVKSIEDSQKNMGGLLLEQTAARRLLPRITRELRISRPKTLKSLDRALPEDVEDALYDAVDRDEISLEAANSVAVCDLIMTGMRGNERTPIYVVAEVSGTLNQSDITRAKERAAILEKATGVSAVPAVAAVIIPELQHQQANRESVLLYRLENQW